MRVLFATEQFHFYTGSEIVVLEAAEFFRARGWECVVAANWVGRPLAEELSRAGIGSTDRLEDIDAFSFDVVWIQHLTAPLLRYALGPQSRDRTLFVFAHLSAREPFEAAVTLHEDILADIVLANSAETAGRLRDLAVPDERISIFHNAAPAAYWRSPRTHSPAPQRILVISNHLPPELRAAMNLMRRDAEVQHIGMGGMSKRVLPEDLADADVVVAIGKSVQYALAGRVPVYVYDVFGGPGYMNATSFERAARYNFSGRCSETRRSARGIVRDIFGRYAEACAFASSLDRRRLARFDLDRYLDDLTARPAGANDVRYAAMAAERGFLEREKATAQIVKSTSGPSHRLTHSLYRQDARPWTAARPSKQSPELAVVVISVGAPAELAQAVASLLAQPEPLEIVVVNSGGGDPHALLRRFGERIRIVSVEQRLWPGAARNVGIAQTKAPFVAFLASDCTALKGWATWRLNHHVAGAAAVASALVNRQPRNPFAVASHVSLFARRLPGVDPREALRYGCSFARSLFDEYGLFREDLRAGEDTEFAARLPDRLQPIWAPEVRTAHNSPTSFTSMLLDQYARGRRTAAARAALGLPEPRGSIRFAYSRFVGTMRLALRATKGRQRLAIALLWALIACCAVANALGMARGGLSEDARAPGSEGKTFPARSRDKAAARAGATAA